MATSPQHRDGTDLLGVAALAVCGTAFLAYVANTVLYLTPPNPLKMQLLPVISAIQHPLFAQNWHLFAPNPIRRDFVLTVRCRVGAAVGPWHDITAPLVAAHQRTRSSPWGRLLRVQQNAVRVWLGRFGDEDWRAAVCRVRPQDPYCRGTDDVARRMRENGAHVLGRVASVACDRFVGRGRAAAVQVALLVHTPPPISRRFSPDDAGTTAYVLLPWMPYQRVGG